MLHNYYTQGGTWVKYRVPLSEVQERMRPVKEASAELGEFLEELIAHAGGSGFFGGRRAGT